MRFTAKSRAFHHLLDRKSPTRPIQPQKEIGDALPPNRELRGLRFLQLDYKQSTIFCLYSVRQNFFGSTSPRNRAIKKATVLLCNLTGPIYRRLRFHDPTHACKGPSSTDCVDHKSEDKTTPSTAEACLATSPHHAMSFASR